MKSNCSGLRFACGAFLASSFLSVNVLASVAVVPGALPIALPGTTFAAEPDLGGPVLGDKVIPFRIVNSGGALLFEGKLQNRVVRSSTTSKLHFYYRIFETQGGLNGIIQSVFAAPFSPAVSSGYKADWRLDGLGNTSPGEVSRGVAGGRIEFRFNNPSEVLVGGYESHFFFLKSTSKNFSENGLTNIRLTTGDNITLSKTFTPSL
jgi:hypothetical protein